MASDNDEMNERLIEFFRPRLRGLIEVQQILDHLHFIADDQKELIRQKEANDGNLLAMDLLIGCVTKRPHKPGWFITFVDALEHSGFRYAVDFMRVNLPDPEVEEKNDQAVKLIQLLLPSLVDMKTEDVCLHCLAQELITEEDNDIIRATTTNGGRMRGARQLLERIVRGQPGWFSKFLHVLRETGHESLYHELSGSKPDDDEQQGSHDKPSVKDEPESGTSAEESPVKADSSEIQPLEEKSTDEDRLNEDLYKEANTNSHELTDSLQTSQPDGKANIVLRDYQMEVAKPALEGKNIIICLPTGSGKTRVAVYITQKHLDGRRAEKQPGKVVVLVNKIPLVEQHYSSEFLPFLRPTYKVERVSGDSQLKISFTEIVKKNDVIICTAQILQNYLERANEGEDEGINLSDLTLIIIDECHHTQKGEVYNHIMMRYLKQKYKNIRMKKMQKQTVPLPQILGLTASPGVGSATKMEKAEEHILRICANLDASRIMMSSHEGLKKEPRKMVETVEERKADPFGDVIKNIMNCIHTHAGLSPTCDLGSQNYEQWIVQKEDKAAIDEDQVVRVCAEHLRQYSEGLMLSNYIRMQDSFNFLSKFYEEEMKKKNPPDEEQIIKITDTERFLFNLFADNKEELKMLAEQPEYENDSLSKLRAKILQEFSTREMARGIIFTKTRRSAIALSQWIQENSKFTDIGVNASYVIGGGDQSTVKPMTAAEQKDTLNKFTKGKINLLIATSVVEEGVDIPTCNFVIQYGPVTNEISMIQAEGRGRAKDSSFIIIEIKDSGVTEKNFVNEHRKNMMYKAIDRIRALNQEEYDNQIQEFQTQAIVEWKVRNTMKMHKDMKTKKPAEVKFMCRRCGKDVCNGEDVEIIEKMHRVNLTPQFSELFIQRENTTLVERCLDYETNGYIACKHCGQRWGSMMLYRGIDCPCLHVKNFVVMLNGKKIPKCTKWSELTVSFSAFNYAGHASRLAQSSDDEEA